MISSLFVCAAATFIYVCYTIEAIIIVSFLLFPILIIIVIIATTLSSSSSLIWLLFFLQRVESVARDCTREITNNNDERGELHRAPLREIDRGSGSRRSRSSHN